MKQLFKVMVVMVAFGFFSQPTVAAESDQQRIADIITPLMRQHDIPGMAVAVVQGDKRFVLTYGLAAVGEGKPVNRDTLFELGSISKLFTGLLGAYAHETGKLDWDAPASRYWPALQGSALDKVMMKQLATYSAGGLPLQFPDRVKNKEADIADYYRQWKPSYPAGEQRLYSNPSIGLFGFLTAKSLGMPFDKAVEQVLLSKLDMRNTRIVLQAGDKARYAWGHAEGGQRVRVMPGPLDSEAYGIKSSGADMLKLLSANIDGVKDPALQAALQDTQRVRYQAGDLRQGLGWEIYRYPVVLPALLGGNSNDMAFNPHKIEWLRKPERLPAGLYNKTGSTRGFGAYVLMVPEQKIGIAMLANRNYPNSERVAAGYRILSVLLASPAKG